MANEYYLRDYTLTPEPGDYIAILVNKGTTTLEDLAQMMVQQGSSLAIEDIRVVFGEIRRAAQALLNRGFQVTGPLCIISPTIQGVFIGEHDRYDPLRHKVRLRAMPDLKFEDDWKARAVFTKIEAPVPATEPLLRVVL